VHLLTCQNEFEPKWIYGEYSSFKPPHYSNLLLKYASWLSAQIIWQKVGFLFYCLNMSCIVICHECMKFLRLKFNVGFLKFCWNASNNRRNSSYICSTSVWALEQINWCRCWGQCCVELQSLWSQLQFEIQQLSWHVGFRRIMFSRLSQTLWMLPILTSYFSPSARLLGMFGLLNFAKISHRWALVKWVTLSFIYFPLRFIKSKSLEKRYE
jgi:hypothetical protein